MQMINKMNVNTDERRLNVIRARLGLLGKCEDVLKLRNSNTYGNTASNPIHKMVLGAAS